MPSAVAATARAHLQILTIVDYLNEQNPAASRRFQERLAIAYRQLSEFPLSGARGRTSNTRRLIVAPYILTYRIMPAGIEILDVRHGRQRERPPLGDM
jgi:toxin ParE1/3/4